jgi:hypothetical protein
MTVAPASFDIAAKGLATAPWCAGFLKTKAIRRVAPPEASEPSRQETVHGAITY